jgi:hypothetical protein
MKTQSFALRRHQEPPQAFPFIRFISYSLPCIPCFEFDCVPEVTGVHAHRDFIHVTRQDNVTSFSHLQLFLGSLKTLSALCKRFRLVQ